MFSPKPFTVSQVMSDFQKKIDALKHVAAEQKKEASRQAQAVEDARAAMNAATKEAELAESIIKNLEKAYTSTSTISAAELRSQCA